MLTVQDVGRLKEHFGQSIIDEAVAFGKARWPLKLGRREESLKKLSLFLERHPNGLLAPEARRALVPPIRKKVAQPRSQRQNGPQ